MPSTYSLIVRASLSGRLALAVLYAVATAVVAACGGGKGAKPEAVILITLDTTRADRLGCYGNRRIETPALDRLAAGGALFEQAQTVAPFTLPAHASILTGRYPAQHGVHHNGLYALPESERTLAEAFTDAGWDTAAVIASFPVAARFGLRQGFASWDESFLARAGARRKFQFEERDAAAVTDAAIAWLSSRSRGRPWFLWVHYFDPHVRYAPPEPFREKYRENPYDGEIAYVDSQIARLMEAAGKSASPERILVAAVGDHGEGLREHGEVSHGFFAYQATIRVPLILSGPGVAPAGRRIAVPVSTVDIYATIARLAGLSRPADAPPLAGRDLLEPGGAPREVVYEAMMPFLEFGWSPLHGIRDGAWSYIEAPRPELYDLAGDPGETKNRLEPEAAAGTDGSGASGATRGPTAAGANHEDAERAATLKNRLRAAFAGMESASGGSAARPAGSADLEALRSLGYMATGSAAAAPKAGSTSPGDPGSPPLADPKDRIAVSERINDIAVLLNSGHGEEAVAASAKLLESWPGERSVRAIHGEALLAAGQSARLLTWLDTLTVPGRPRESWAATLRARAFEADGSLDDAIAAHREAAATGPAAGSSRLQAAVLLRKADRLAESTREAREVASRTDPLAAEAWRLIADNERDEGRPAESLAALEKAEAAAPDDPAVLAELGRALMQAGRLPDARRVADRLTASAPDMPDGPLLSGACDVAEGNPRAAVPKLQRVLDAEPGNADALYWMATARLDAGETAEAEAPARRLAQERPESWLSQRTLGRLLLAQGRRPEAAAALHRALTLRPGDPVAVDLLRQADGAP